MFELRNLGLVEVRHHVTEVAVLGILDELVETVDEAAVHVVPGALRAAELPEVHINNFNSRIKVSSANYLFMLKPHKLPKIFFSLAQTQTKHSLAKPYYVLYLKRIINLYSPPTSLFIVLQ